jgi:hypothetical protein
MGDCMAQIRFLTKAIARHLERAMPALVVVAIAAYALLSTGQGKDILRASVGDPGLTARLGFAALILSIVGGTCIGFVAQFDRESPADEIGGIGFLLSMGLAGLSWLIMSFGLNPPEAGLKATAPLLAWFGIMIVAMTLAAAGSYFLSRSLRNPIWLLIPSAGFLVLFASIPAVMGGLLGSALTLAFILSAWTILISALVIWQRTHVIPLVGYLLLGVLGMGLVGAVIPTSNRDLLRGTARFKAGTKFEDFYAEWRRTQPNDRPTIVFVAAAGGGIRASFWTSLILARATDRAPVLRDRLFLASGVSGGSLGLSVYRSLLDVPKARCNYLEDCVAAFHKHDFLAGILGASLSAAIFNSVLPVFPDRSRALEEAWENAWTSTGVAAEAAKVENHFAGAFEQLWNKQGPAVVLNTTSNTGGDRIAISNLSTEWLAIRGPCKANIAEHLQLPVSTAANASARFPFLEEWGSFRVLANQQEHAESQACSSYEAVADGGFVDNYGAETIQDALDRLQALLNSKSNERRPHIVVIQITSDPDCRIADAIDPESRIAMACEENAKLRREAGRIPSLLAALLDPMYVHRHFERFRTWTREWLLFDDPRRTDNPGVLDVLSNARTVNGLNVAAALRCRVLDMGGSYYQFSMTGAFDNPLGWSLSLRAQEQLKGLLQTGANTAAMDALINELNNKGAIQQKPKCNTAQLRR